MSKIKDTILDRCVAVLDEVKNPDRKYNVGARLFEIFCWQEISKLADERLKESWSSAAEAGLIKTDDHYRNLGAGEVIAAESPSFSALMKISAPRKNLNRNDFLNAVARKARISRESLEELWDDCSEEGKPPLSKRILEV